MMNIVDCGAQPRGKIGFTLIELLIVVALIGILSGLVLSIINPRGFKAKARDGQRVADLKKIQTGLELYFADYRVYPVSGGWLRVVGSDVLSNALSPEYINVVPVDPLQTGTSSDACSEPEGYRYNYRSDSGGSTYVLTAIVEVATSNDGYECSVLNNWGALGCGGSFETSDVCYGVENP